MKTEKKMEAIPEKKEAFQKMAEMFKMEELEEKIEFAPYWDVKITWTCTF